MARRVGVVWAVVWLVLVLAVWGVLYGVAMFSGTTATKSGISTSEMSAEYRWDGDPIAIKSAGRQPRCVVRPDSGESYPIPRLNYPNRFTAGWEGMRPRFSGSATVACTNAVTVYSGRTLGLLKWLSINPVRIALAIVGGLPLMLVWVFGPVQRKPVQRK